jgi:hydrogenase maturation protease
MIRASRAPPIFCGWRWTAHSQEISRVHFKPAMENTPAQVLVIGIGNAYRSDDAAGLVAVRRVKEKAPISCAILEHTGEGAALMELWKGADHVFVIDAVHSGAAPGTVTRFDASLHPLPASMFRNSTHAFSLVEAIELARALNQLPGQMIVYGIEGQTFEAGINLSPAIEFGLHTLGERVLQELGQNVPCSRT